MDLQNWYHGYAKMATVGMLQLIVGIAMVAHIARIKGCVKIIP